MLDSGIFYNNTSCFWIAVQQSVRQIWNKSFYWNQVEIIPLQLLRIIHSCSPNTYCIPATAKQIIAFRKPSVWNHWTYGSKMLQACISDILTMKKQEPRLCVHVRCVHIVHIGCFVCSAGYVTSPFITPYGQLSAEGKMEVVSWGPAGGYGYH